MSEGDDTESTAADWTADAFHRGDFWLIQPKGKGHRAGTDAMMLAAAVPLAFNGVLADLGAGAGAAGLAIASRCGGARVVLVERSPEMIAFARRTLDDPRNAHLADRVGVLQADASLAGRAREAAGLGAEAFDFVLMNPPFNDNTHRASPDALKRAAHVMDEGLFEAWLRTAAAIVRPGGGFAAIVRPQSLGLLLQALSGRFGAVEIVPIHPRPESLAIRVVLRARRAARAPLSLLPPLALHDGPSHGFSPRADALNNGRASLFGD